MARERKLEKDKQTHFGKEFQKLGDYNYLTDVDQVVITTENEIYHHYQFKQGRPTIKRVVEVKHKVTDYIRRQVKHQDPPNPQTYFFASMCTEINSFRATDSTIPLVEFYYVVQTDGGYPYTIFNVTETDGEVKYNYLTKVENYEQFEAEMKK